MLGTRRMLACGLAWLATTLALEAKWTPAGDGPSRFSKRYRDQAGIGALTTQHARPPHSPSTPSLLTVFWRCLADDSRWTNDRRNDAGWFPSGLLPETTLGWIVTVLAIAGILVLLQRSAEPAFAAGGQQLGSAANTAAAAAGPLPWGRPPAAEDLASSREAREKREAFLRRFDNTEKRQ